MPTVELSEGRVSYRVAGPVDSPAPPVVLVHGLLNDSGVWSRVTELLAARGVRSYAADWPLGAHREPRGSRADLSPRGIARQIVEFLDVLGLDDVTLVGNDTGGALCQFALDEDPRRIGRLVLTNCDGFDIFPPRQFKRLLSAMRSPRRVRLIAKLMRAQALRRSQLGFGPLAHNLPAELTRGWIDPVINDPAIAQDLAAFARAVDPGDLLDVSTRLGKFRGAVTMAWGADDRAFTEELGRRLAGLFDDARFVSVPNSRTLVQLDAPEALADEIVAIASRPAARDHTAGNGSK